MKLNVKRILSVGVILPMFFVGTVWAQGTRPEPANDEKLLERLEERKKNLEPRLTALQIEQVKLQCKSAQGKIMVVQGRLNGKAAQRATKYTKAIENLSRLSAKLKSSEIDTTEFDAQITELKTAVENYSVSFSEFRQLIDDLVNMDCESEPESFKATLLEAREKRAEIVQSASEAKNFFTTKIKPILLTIRESVAKGTNSPVTGGTN